MAITHTHTTFAVKSVVQRNRVEHDQTEQKKQTQKQERETRRNKQTVEQGARRARRSMHAVNESFDQLACV